MKENKNWYVIHTKPKFEKKVAVLLEKKQVPTFLPEYSKLQYLFGRKRTIKVPVMPSILFVFSSEQELNKVTSTDGVAGLFYKFQKPATIKSKEVTAMQRFLINYTGVAIDKIPLGCSAENEEEGAKLPNSSLSKNGNTTEKLFLPSIGFCLVAKSQQILLDKVA